MFIISQYLTKERLQEAFDKKLLSKNPERYDSYENLKNFFAQYSHSSGLTVRELKDFSIELARICNNFYEPIRVQWLSCVMSYKKFDKNFDFNYPLPKEHCYYKERYTGGRGNNLKTEILKLSDYYNELKHLKRLDYIYNSLHQIVDSHNYYDFYKKYCSSSNTQRSYSEISSFFACLENDIKITKEYYNECKDVISNLIIVEKAVKNKKKLCKTINSNMALTIMMIFAKIIIKIL